MLYSGRHFVHEFRDKAKYSDIRNQNMPAKGDDGTHCFMKGGNRLITNREEAISRVTAVEIETNSGSRPKSTELER